MSPDRIGYTKSEHYNCIEDLELLYPHKTMTPLLLAYCGREDCAPGWTFGPYVRKNYVLHIITAGNGTYETPGGSFRLSANQAFLVYPGEETTYMADDEDPWSYMWIGFNGYWAERVAEEAGFTKNNPVITFDDCTRISNDIDAILDADGIEFADHMRRMASFYDAISTLIDSDPDRRPERHHSDRRYVDMAIRLMTESFDKRIKISEIAGRVGINRSYLADIFKREMNMSPQTFLINYRLEKAAQLLLETRDSIGDIANSVGYNDPLAFSKAFKQRYGESPSAYRNADRGVEHKITKGYENISRL